MPGHRPTARRAVARVAALLALTSLATCLGACASPPYVDSRREAGKKIMVGPSNAEVVAICYKGGTPGPDVIKLAEGICRETGRTPQYVSHTRFTCNMLAPSRAYFRCVAPDATQPTSTPGG